MLRAVFCGGLIFAITCAGALAQADFSADIVNLSAASNTFHTRIFSTRDKLRFQGEDKAGRTNSIMIVNLAEGTHIVLLPQQKQYVVSKRTQIPGQGVVFFQAKDVENACGQWLTMMPSVVDADDSQDSRKAPPIRHSCRKIGHETVNNRDTVKYEDTSKKGDASAIWLDVKLRFPMKWKNAVGGGELRNIKEEAQPAGLFEIPKGYVKRSFHTKPSPGPEQH